MKFKCLECGEKEFWIDISELKNDQVTVRIVCPDCGSRNEVSVFEYDNVRIETVKDQMVFKLLNYSDFLLIENQW